MGLYQTGERKIGLGVWSVSQIINFMKQGHFRMNIIQLLFAIGVMMAFGLACQLMRDSKYEDDNKSPRRTPTTESTRSGSPTPSVSPSASTSPASNSNN